MSVRFRSGEHIREQGQERIPKVVPKVQTRCGPAPLKPGAAHDIRASVPKGLDEALRSSGLVLEIGVLCGDDVPGDHPKPCSQCGTFPLVARMRHHTNFGVVGPRVPAGSRGSGPSSGRQRRRSLTPGVLVIAQGQHVFDTCLQRVPPR